MAKSSSYAEKQLKFGKHVYDVTSKEFQAGAWKNLSSDEYTRNSRALNKQEF